MIKTPSVQLRYRASANRHDVWDIDQLKLSNEDSYELTTVRLKVEQNQLVSDWRWLVL